MSINSIDGSIASSNYSVQALQSEISNLKHQLEGKELEIGELSTRHQLALSEREVMENQMKKMKERVHESDSKLLAMMVRLSFDV